MAFLLRIVCISLLVTLLMIPDSRANNTIYPCNQCSSITIRNFGKVSDCYYRGGQPKLSEFCQLKNCGVKTIISFRKPFCLNNNSNMEREKALANQLGMNFVNIPLHHSVPPTNEQIECFFNIISNPQNLPVFVHCDQGKDRTGLMTALYRVRCCGWGYNQAYTEMRNYGYHLFLFPGLKFFLMDYSHCMCKLRQQRGF